MKDKKNQNNKIDPIKFANVDNNVIVSKILNDETIEIGMRGFKDPKTGKLKVQSYDVICGKPLYTTSTNKSINKRNDDESK